MFINGLNGEYGDKILVLMLSSMTTELELVVNFLSVEQYRATWD